MTFPEFNAELRTDLSFRNRLQPEHHKEERSKLEELEMDLVFDVPEDEMHLIDCRVLRISSIVNQTIDLCTFLEAVANLPSNRINVVATDSEF